MCHMTGICISSTVDTWPLFCIENDGENIIQGQKAEKEKIKFVWLGCRHKDEDKSADAGLDDNVLWIQRKRRADCRDWIRHEPRKWFYECYEAFSEINKNIQQKRWIGTVLYVSSRQKCVLAMRRPAMPVKSERWEKCCVPVDWSFAQISSKDKVPDIFIIRKLSQSY